MKLVKEAVSKSDSIIRFIDTGGALRGILLVIGLLVVAFSAVFYYLMGRYGSFEAVPVNLRIALFVLIGLSKSLPVWKISSITAAFSVFRLFPRSGSWRW